MRCNHKSHYRVVLKISTVAGELPLLWMYDEQKTKRIRERVDAKK
jgi:hypothetical protein